MEKGEEGKRWNEETSTYSFFVVEDDLTKKKKNNFRFDFFSITGFTSKAKKKTMNQRERERDSDTIADQAIITQFLFEGIFIAGEKTNKVSKADDGGERNYQRWFKRGWKMFSFSFILIGCFYRIYRQIGFEWAWWSKHSFRRHLGVQSTCVLLVYCLKIKKILERTSIIN